MTSLRPLEKPQVHIAASVSAGRPPKLDFLSLAKLRVDDTYQRRIERNGIATIVRICNEFDWRRFAPLIVARVPGPEEIYAIIDGQHRATAALLRGFDRVPCCIVEASALEQPAIFAAVNGNVTPVTIFQLFKAARVAKAGWAVAIDQVCAEVGIVPLVYPKSRKKLEPFETMAIGTLRQAIIRFGETDVTAALNLARKNPNAAEPGFWSSGAINLAIADWRVAQGKRAEPSAAVSTHSLAERIRDLRLRGHSRFAIQSALGCRLADIEAAIEGGAQ